jgi:hypothetical protein
MKKIPLKYVALDNDKAGRAAMVAAAKTFGAMTRLVQWQTLAEDGADAAAELDAARSVPTGDEDDGE